MSTTLEVPWSDAPRPCSRDCAALDALKASVEATNRALEGMKAEQALHLALFREFRAEMVNHHALLMRWMDTDSTPPFGRPRGAESL